MDYTGKQKANVSEDQIHLKYKIGELVKQTYHLRSNIGPLKSVNLT